MLQAALFLIAVLQFRVAVLANQIAVASEVADFYLAVFCRLYDAVRTCLFAQHNVSAHGPHGVAHLQGLVEDRLTAAVEDVFYCLVVLIAEGVLELVVEVVLLPAVVDTGVLCQRQQAQVEEQQFIVVIHLGIYMVILIGQLGIHARVVS